MISEIPKILIVEDDELVALDLTEILKELGYCVVDRASTAETAIQCVDRSHPDLVLMDIRLKGQHDGIYAAEKIYNKHHIPIIFLTAYADDETIRRAKDSHAVGYLLKPFQMQELKAAVDMAFKHSESEKFIYQGKVSFEDIVRNFPDGVIILDKNYFMQYLNPAAQKILGIKLSEALGEKFPYALEFAEKFEVGIETEIGKRTIVEMHTLETFWQGEGAFMISLHDITWRKEAEGRLRDSEQRLRFLFEYSPDPIYLTNLSGVFLDINKKAEQKSGYSRQQVLGRSFIDLKLISENEIPKAQQCLREAAEGRGFGPEDFTLIRSNNKKIRLEIVGYPLQIKDERMILNIARDVTERRQVEDDLRKLSNAVEQSASMTLITNAKGEIEYANPKFLQVTGYTSQEIIGKNPRILKSGNTALEVYRELWKTISSGNIWQGEFENRKKNGGSYWVKATISPVKDSTGAISHYLGIQEDVTQQRILAEQLLQSQKMEAVGKLAGGIAHDFHNLLTIIKGYSEFILAKTDSVTGISQYATEILNASNRAEALTRQLLAFSRRQVIQPQVIDLNVLIKNIEKMLCRLIGEDFILESRLEVGLGPIKVDPGQMEQVLLNLVVNARDSMPKGGKIIIETRHLHLTEKKSLRDGDMAPSRYAHLMVIDSGEGIPEAILPRIFEPFFTTKKVGKGTGLGLSTCYGIVKQAEGHIEIDSQIGKGTIFHLYFPLIKESLNTSAVQKQNQELQRGSETILFVEDEAALRNMGVQFFRQQGYKVMAAMNGEKALEMLESSPNQEIDILVTDVIMPGMGGAALVEKIREKYPKIKVLFISGYTDDVISHRGVLNTEANLLQKPFSLEQLATRLRKVLDAGKTSHSR